MHDLEPATRALSRVVDGISDEQLDHGTPCAPSTVAALLDHVRGLALAFALAAAKTPPEGGSQPPVQDAARLPADWRTSIPQRLAALRDAWRDPQAWQGDTEVGGIHLPGSAAGFTALNEVTVHAWDLAVSTGQQLDVDEALVSVLFDFVSVGVRENPAGVPGLFGPALPVPDDAPVLDRLIGITGRDPGWRGHA